MSEITKAVMPFSGGMDSAVLLRMQQYSVNELHLLTFDYGQRHKRELECAKTQIEQAEILSFSHAFEHHKIVHKTIDLQVLKELTSNVSSLTNEDIDNPDVNDMVGEAQPASYVPFRNQLFLTFAAMYAENIGASKIYHGATKVDSLAGYWDGSEEFRTKFGELIALNRTNRITLECPLLNMDKKDIIEYGIEHKVDFSQTYTCYSGNELADATTPSSALRIKGFGEAGYIDPQPYKQDLSVFWEEYDAKPCPVDFLLSKGGSRGS